MKPREIFNGMLKTYIQPSLKPLGYKHRNSNFILTSPESNLGIVNFQKSSKSKADFISFTVNLGVCSSRLLKYFGYQYSNLEVWDCHWQSRLGHLMSEGSDLWWSIDASTSLNELAETINTALLSVGTPAIQQFLSDTELRDMWISGRSPGITKMQRLMYLSVLISDLGPKEYQSNILSEMELMLAQNNSPILKAHIEKIHKLYDSK